MHCYLDHNDHGEMDTAEIKDLLEQMAAAGVFFLTISGGEILMRRDFFEIVEHARQLMFCVKLKTNAVMIHEAEADRIHTLAPESVQISVYSHRPEVHDAITKLPGSLKKSMAGARLLVERGVKVIFANVLMRDNFQDYSGVQALAAEVARFGVKVTVLCPGPTESEFWDVSRASAFKRRVQSTPEVARLGINALARGKRTIIANVSGRISAFMVRFLPVNLITYFIEKAARSEAFPG